MVALCMFVFNNPTCVGERRNSMNAQLYLFDPSTGVIHGEQPGFSPTQAVGGSSLFKTCTKCKKTKLIFEFYTGPKGFRARCKLCFKECIKKHVIGNPEVRREIERKYWRKNKEKNRAKGFRWRKSNPQKLAELNKKFYYLDIEKSRTKSRNWHKKNKERSSINARNWLIANPQKNVEFCERRRARKLNAKGHDYTKAHHITARWAMWGNKCWMCGQPAEHTDHVIPLCAGGSHWPANLRPACAKCNCSRPKDGSDLPTRKKA
jgi:hypothetical protein